jgi:hypothetical protein
VEFHPYTPPPQVRKAPARAPVQGDKPGIEHLPDTVRDDVRARREELDRRLDPWSDEAKARMKRYALACGLCFPILVKLIAGTPLRAVPIEVLAGAAYGTFIAFRRSGQMESGLALILTGITCQLIHGTLALTFITIFTVAIYAVVGAFLGLHHEARAWDGQ